MTSAIQAKETTASNVVHYQELLPRHGPSWLVFLRKKAMSRFTEMGFPTNRMEDWRFLNVSPIADCDFAVPARSTVALRDVEPFQFQKLSGSRIVFVNGHYSAELSNTSSLSNTASVLDLSVAAESHQDLVQKHLGQYADHKQHAFTALNTAMINGGLFVHVPKNTVVNGPIHVLNLTIPQDEPTMTNPRILVVAEHSSQVTLIEDYVSTGDGVYLTNAVTECVVGPNAVVTHYMLQRESKAAFNISTLQVHQDRDSNFTSHTLMLGSAIARNNINSVLEGTGCESLLNGLYALESSQVADNHMILDHAKSHCNSRQFYKGIMSEKARGMFRGRIIVRPDAQKTDAKQSNQNLLLSEQATANSDPQLEIYADDVKCTHGSTTGQIDENAMFYLQARGIPKTVARAMLVYAFASESLQRITIEPIRDYFKRVILEQLLHDAGLKELV